MRKVSVALTVMVLAAVAVPVMAHHSASMFDGTKRVESEGIVKELEVINPHTKMTLTVTDAKGTRDIRFEGLSINGFYRYGWRPDMIKIGDKIKVSYSPRKDGADGGHVMGLTTAAGRVIAFTFPTEADNPISVPPPAAK